MNIKDILKMNSHKRNYLLKFIGMLSIGGVSVNLFNPDMLEIYTTCCAIGFGGMFSHNIDKNIKNYNLNNLIDKINNSSQKEECQKLYQEYISKLGNLLKEHSTDDTAFSQSQLFYELLKVSIFTNSEEKYQDFKYDIESRKKCITDIYGARVLTGASVCRHKASMLTDVLESIGHKTLNLKVYMFNNNIKDNYILNKKANHLVTGVISDNGRFIYDPTNLGLALPMNIELDKKFLKECLKNYNHNDSNYEYLTGNLWMEYLDNSSLYRLINKKTNYNNKRCEEELLNSFFNSDNILLDDEYINTTIHDTKMLLITKRDNFLDFCNDNNQLVEDITSLYMEMVSFANSKKVYKKQIKELKKIYR